MSDAADTSGMTPAEAADLLTAMVALATACTAFVAAAEHLYPVLVPKRMSDDMRAVKEALKPPDTIRGSKC